MSPLQTAGATGLSSDTGAQHEPLTEFELLRFAEYVKQSTYQALRVFDIPEFANSDLRREVEEEGAYLTEIRP